MILEDDLTAAAAAGQREEVERLLREGARVNRPNRFKRTAIQVVMMGSTSVVRFLLESGADPNVADRSTGSSPLHDAARTGFVDTVRLLVQFGADPQAKDNNHHRPVDLATQHGHVEVVDFLQSL